MEKAEEKLTTKSTVAFGFGGMTDQMSHQAFQVLIFTFYYAVVGVSLTNLMIAFIIFAIWDSINDPIVGIISDKTKSKFGRRRFWVLIIVIPFAIVHLLLFTPPYESETGKVVYMFIIIMVYDLVYTIFSSNQTALFSEMFPTEAERSKANMYKNILTIVGILLGAVLPTLLISPMAPTEETPPEVRDKIPSMYLQTGILLCILVVIFGFLFFKFGMKERTKKAKVQTEQMPGIMESLKITLKNKAFIIFVIGNLFVWFVFKMLTTLVPLYGIHVLGIKEGSFGLTLLLLVAFLTATAFFPIMRKIGLKIGMRNAFILSETIWIFALIPFYFLDNQPTIAMICMAFVGIGLSGAMYFVDIIIAQIIDEDEVKTGKQRAGSYYGVNALINRYSTILVFVSISLILSGYGWENYLVGAGLDQEGLKTGLKILMVILPICGILVVLLCLAAFPIHGERLKQIQQQIKELKEKSK